MRTTVDLPEDLFRAVKAEAALRGESLKAFFYRAISAELEGSKNSPSESQRIELPLVRSSVSKDYRAGDGELAEILAEEDHEIAS